MKALVSLAWIRAILLVVFVAIPRLILAIILGYGGVLYLGLTDNMGGLLLNAMVGFDSYVDELSYVGSKGLSVDAMRGTELRF